VYNRDASSRITIKLQERTSEELMSGVPGKLPKPDVVAQALIERGLPEGESEAKAALLGRCAAALSDAGVRGTCDLRALVVPGRIEVLGKHTDYAGGRSVLAATERGFCIIVSPRRDSTVRMIDVVRRVGVEFEIHPHLVPGPDWTNYPMTVARRVARNFTGPLVGAEIAFGSDLPADSGLSSSSALITATFLALSHANRLPDRPEYRQHIDSLERLGEYLGTCENGQSFGPLAGDKGVGTFGGSEDHTAILCSKAGTLSVYSFCPVRPERTLPMPAGMVFAVAFSGITANKTGSAREQYNRASRLASAAAEQWRRATGRAEPHLASIIASSPDARDRLRAALNGGDASDCRNADLLRRSEQFIVENEEIIPAAVDALAAGDLDAFARQVSRSQQYAISHLGNQVPETIFLARSARDAGAAAASVFGAGFGGSVWAMVGSDSASEFLREWRAIYRVQFPSAADRAEFFITGAGPGAISVELDGGLTG